VFIKDEAIWESTADGQIRPLGDLVVQDIFDAHLSRDGGKLVYGVLGQQGYDIWFSDLQAGSSQNITASSPRLERCPVWEMSGGGIFFGYVDDWDDLGPTCGRLAGINLDGTGFRVFDDLEIAFPPSISPEGRRLAISTVSQGLVLDLDNGVEAIDPVEYGISVDKFFTPAWSPAGDAVAWIVNQRLEGEFYVSLIIFDLANESARTLHSYVVAGCGAGFQPPTWSPKGDWIAFSPLCPANKEDEGLLILQSDGESVLNLGQGSNVVWGLDGSQLVFATFDDGASIWHFDLRTGVQSEVHALEGAQIIGWR
jgi:Tol biopolymer transport system component